MATPASTREALEMIRDGLRYLAVTDPTALASQAQAECLQTLEQADAMRRLVASGLLPERAGPPPRGTPTAPRSSTATAHPPAPGNDPLAVDLGGASSG